MAKKIEPTMDYYRQISGSIPTVVSHFFSQPGSLCWDALSGIGRSLPAFWDHQLFAGALATLCLIVAFVWMIVMLVKVKFRVGSLSSLYLLLLAGLVTILLYLRFGNISAYILVYHLPGFSSMRSVTRIINVELIFFAVAVAFVYAEILSAKFKSQIVLFIVCLCLLIADNYFYADKSYKTTVSIAEQRTNRLAQTFASIPAHSVVSYEPMDTTDASHLYQIDAMMVSQAYDHIALNGYTANCPGDYGMYWNEPNAESRMHWLADREIATDTLYVVKGIGTIDKIPRNALINSEILGIKQKGKLQSMMNYIRSDNAWMEQLQEKSLQKNISVDSMLVLDAQWMIDNEK